ncbi:DUF2141 domain-containing protein [Marinicella gelatinilytica]|uniref:DUF2141 domain-containing protein n=1 Tax=Marinicella gelatinilytica TaxID=2996017 RepID=UPI002260A804|nr:DUF2141 domain-containing protein [Marinicella gelatinilytica]MCX7545849.1 DUF2141 domain-containing protein [Marinicella gelatinilytica]
MNLRKAIATGLLILSITCSVKAADLTVTIDHIKSDEGTVYAQLFLGEDSYNNNNAAQSAMMPAKQGAGEFTFKDLTPGDYVVRLYHDENGNQQLDMNAFGMPLEGYGFSNEAVANMGPPQYKDMVVRIEESDGVVKTKTKMTYL